MTNYLVIDLECTCWEYNDPNKQDHETIEIGAVLLDKNFKKVRDRACLVRPLHNPILTEFCTDLTNITQTMIDTKSVSFPSAIASLSSVVDEDTIFCSWGYFDKNQLTKECESHDIDYPFPDKHINIKQEFMDHFNKKRCGLQKACRMLSLRFNGVPHRALSDANMTAEVFRILRSTPKSSAKKRKKPGIL